MAIITVLAMTVCMSATVETRDHEGCVDRSVWFVGEWEGPEGVFECEAERLKLGAELLGAGKSLTHKLYCDTDPHGTPRDPAYPAQPEEGPDEACRTELCRYVRETQSVSFHL